MNTRRIIVFGAVLLVLAAARTSIAQQTKTSGSSASDAQLKRHFNRAALSIRSRQFQTALDEIEVYLGHRPDDPGALTIYGNALLGLERYEEATTFYGLLLRKNPREVKILYGFAFASEKSGRFADAIRTNQRVLALDPEHAICRNNLAWLLATAPEDHLRDGRKSVALIEQSVRQHGRDEWWMADTLAAGLAETGNFDDAVKVQELAVNLAPSSKRANLRARLQLYQNGEPYRLPN